MRFSSVRIPVFLSGIGALALASCGGTATVPSASSISTMSSAVRSLKCVTLDGGQCSIAPNGDVTLTLADPPAADAGTGVYFAADHSFDGIALSAIKALAFTISGPYQAGSPRVSIPVSYNGAATTAYVYPVSCATLNAGSGSDTAADIDPVGDPSDSAGNYCLEMQGYGNPQYYSDWTTFTSTFGTAVIASPPLFLADADNSSGGTWTLTKFKTQK